MGTGEIIAMKIRSATESSSLSIVKRRVYKLIERNCLLGLILFAQRCKRCKGNGITEQAQIQDIAIERGARTGDRIVLRGEGEQKVL